MIGWAPDCLTFLFIIDTRGRDKAMKFAVPAVGWGKLILVHGSFIMYQIQSL